MREILAACGSVLSGYVGYYSLPARARIRIIYLGAFNVNLVTPLDFMAKISPVKVLTGAN